MRAAALASALLCAIAARAFAPSRGAPRCFAQRAVVDDDAAEAATEVAVVASPLLRPPRCPLNLEGQMIAMRDAVVRADEAHRTACSCLSHFQTLVSFLAERLQRGGDLIAGGRDAAARAHAVA